MGNDGGRYEICTLQYLFANGSSIPKRRELVKEAARSQTVSQVKESQQEQQEYHWTTCPISHRPLKPPVVSDYGGNLYNKDAILEYLLPSDDPADVALKADKAKILNGRVKSLKDVVEVKFEVEESQDGRKTQKWICPITNKALGYGVKAVYIVPCGHTFSEVALREIAETKCLQCGEAYSANNIITILPLLHTEKEALAKRIEALKKQGLTHSLKKSSGSGKKRKKQAVNDEQVTKATDKTGDTSKNGKSNISGIKNAATASLTAKVLAEEQEKAKRRKLERNANLNSLFTSGPKQPEKDADFMTRGYTLATETKR
jgi:hypothetical protein